MKKVKSLFAFLMSAFVVANAQNTIGIDYYRLGDYDLAKQYMEKEMAQHPVMANYYLGEIAFAQGKTEDAKNYYTKGLTADSENPYNKIGLAKLNFKNNPQESLSALIALEKKYRGNIDVYIAIGYAYLDNHSKENTSMQLGEILKIDKKNPKANVFEGDILEKDQDWGGAVGKYDMAIYFDPSYLLAYIKGAKIYENSNWQTAVEKLKEAVKLRPDYIISYRYLGKIYTSNGYYSSAIDAYKIFFEAGHYTLDDIVRYTTALYFNKQYDDAAKLIKEGLAKEPSHFVLNRLQMYAAANTRDHENGLKYAQTFFALKPANSSDYLPKDYEMYAEILKDAKMYDKAFLEYQKAISMDSTSIAIYKEMASLAGAKGENGYAADLYQKYIRIGGDKIEALDYFQLGKYFYSAGNIRKAADTTLLMKLQSNQNFINTIASNQQQKDSLRNDANAFVRRAVHYYLDKAENNFDIVIQRIPDSYTGYLWKARTNSAMDPDSEMGLAKPYYEKAIEIILEKGDATKITNNTLIEAYSYLGYYYYIKNDKSNTLLYWNKVLELDPQNANANTVLKSLK